ncbi:MAG: lipopolysaccharide biosynthesis protein [Geminicoccaceae bacterium]
MIQLRQYAPAALRSEAVRTSLAVLMLNGAGLILAYGVQFLIARLSGAEAFGQFVAATVWIQAVSQVFATGFALTALRVVAEARDDRNSVVEQQFIGFFAVLLGFGAAAGLAIAATVMGKGLGTIGLLIWLGIVGNALITLLGGLVRGYGQTTASILPERLGRDTVALIVVASVLSMTGALLAWQALLAYVLGVWLAGAALLVIWNRAHHWQTAGFWTALVNADAGRRYRQWMGLHSNLAATKLAGIGLARGDLIILSLIAAPDQVGIYASALLIATGMQQLTLAADLVVSPRLAHHAVRNDTSAMERAFARVARGLTLSSVALALVLIALGQPLLSWLGDAFTAGYDLLLIFVARSFLTNGLGSISVLLNLTGHHRVATIIMAVHALALAPSVWLAFQAMGITGAALAASVIAVSAQVVLAIAVHRRVGVNPWRWIIDLAGPSPERTS